MKRIKVVLYWKCGYWGSELCDVIFDGAAIL
jgi:hypothetical protein